MWTDKLCNKKKKVRKEIFLYSFQGGPVNILMQLVHYFYNCFMKKQWTHAILGFCLMDLNVKIASNTWDYNAVNLNLLSKLLSVKYVF